MTIFKHKMRVFFQFRDLRYIILTTIVPQSECKEGGRLLQGDFKKVSQTIDYRSNHIIGII